MYRIGAAIVAALLAVAILFTILSATGRDPVIVPTNGVVRGNADILPANEAARQALAERSRLQDYRGSTGPSPEGGRDGMVTGTPLEDVGRGAEPSELVAGWWGNRETDWQVLREPGRVNGISPTLPDPRADLLIQPGGRDWRRLHNSEIVYGGAWVVLGVSFVLALFLLLRGRVKIKEGWSGRTVPRFGGLERANHWMTATSFLVLALSGLVILYGQHVLRPLMGAEAYSWLAQWSLIGHIAFFPVFTLGVLVMAVVWMGRNWPKGLDLHWLARGGGFLSDRGPNPPAEKFNAGQKLIFWIVMLGGGLMVLSGITLMFPFFWLGMDGMQWALLAHSALGLLMIAAIIGHIYIGTVGMEGAIDAMWSGRVDWNWAKEHHSIWVEHEFEPEVREEETARRTRGRGWRPGRTAPAE